MNAFTSIIKALVGIAMLYYICDVLMLSEKFKPYIWLALGLAVAVTLIEPVGELFNSDFSIDFTLQAVDYGDDYRSNIENIWHGKSSISLQKYVENLIENKNSFVVRTYRESNTYRVYVTFFEILEDDEVTYIKNLICDKTGISPDYVNIYLQNPQNKENTHE